MNAQVKNDAMTLWKYLVCNDTPVSADVLLVLGSIDDRVAKYAAELSQTYNYDLVVFSGGIAHTGDLLQTGWKENEAEHFYNVFQLVGGRAESVLLETAAQNTGQNATLTYELLVRQQLPIPRTMLVLTKPYMTRRAKATFDVQWPCKTTRISVGSPAIAFNEYPDVIQPLEPLVHIMAGDFQRIMEYPKHGLQSRQHIPNVVRAAWERLVEAGYTKHQIK